MKIREGTSRALFIFPKSTIHLLLEIFFTNRTSKLFINHSTTHSKLYKFIYKTTMLPYFYLFLFLIITTASPWGSGTRPTICNAQAGTPGGVYLCPYPNFQQGTKCTPNQTCTWHAPKTPPECINVANLAAPPRSIGPDKGGYCVLYADKDCQGKVVYPFAMDLDE
jgi:hypothetical protein